MVMKVHFSQDVSCCWLWRMLYPGQRLQAVGGGNDCGDGQNQLKRTYKLSGSKKGGQT
jgi:hypothetical protein